MEQITWFDSFLNVRRVLQILIFQVYAERVEQDNAKSTEHFETIQSSVWCNMRFKPPPLDQSDIGWRVEFRPTEVQLTDFENAAYVCFVVLLTRLDR